MYFVQCTLYKEQDTVLAFYSIYSAVLYIRFSSSKILKYTVQCDSTILYCNVQQIVHRQPHEKILKFYSVILLLYSVHTMDSSLAIPWEGPQILQNVATTLLIEEKFTQKRRQRSSLLLGGQNCINSLLRVCTS